MQDYARFFVQFLFDYKYKDFIAHNMTEIIVYRLEKVNICHKQSADAAVGKVMGYFLLEKLSVIKSCKCVEMSRSFQLLGKSRHRSEEIALIPPHPAAVQVKNIFLPFFHICLRKYARNNSVLLYIIMHHSNIFLHIEVLHMLEK